MTPPEPQLFKAGDWVRVAKLSAINQANGVCYPSFIRLTHDTVIKSKASPRTPIDGKLDTLYTLQILTKSGWAFPDLIHWWIKADGTDNLPNMDLVVKVTKSNVKLELANIRTKIQAKRNEIKALQAKATHWKTTFKHLFKKDTK